MQLEIREILCQVIKVVFLIKNSMQNRSKIIGNLNLKSSFTFPVCNRSNHQNSKKIPLEYNRMEFQFTLWNIYAFYNSSKIMKDFNLQIISSLTSFFAISII